MQIRKNNPEPQNGLSPSTRIIVVLVLAAVSIFFWHSIVLYPVKLFVVLMHEFSHALAALLTGGEVLRIEISNNIGGTAYTRGGWEFLVVSSGYLGSMVLGGAVLLLSDNPRKARMTSMTIATVVLLVTLLFVRNVFGLAFGIGFGAALFVSAKYLRSDLLTILLQYLGTMSCLYALIDIKEDLLTLEHRVTDAGILAGMTGIPAIVWGILWSLAALAVFLFIMRLSLKRAGRQIREHNTS